jgi:glycosyltransferase involved in cell wall biosynthesis
VGPAEIVTHEADGLVVPDGERAAFQAAMIRLASDEPLRRTFAAKARLAIRRFDAKAVQPRWDELLSAKRKAC